MNWADLSFDEKLACSIAIIGILSYCAFGAWCFLKLRRAKGSCLNGYLLEDGFPNE